MKQIAKSNEYLKELLPKHGWRSQASAVFHEHRGMLAEEAGDYLDSILKDE